MNTTARVADEGQHAFGGACKLTLKRLRLSWNAMRTAGPHSTEIHVKARTRSAKDVRRRTKVKAGDAATLAPKSSLHSGHEYYSILYSLIRLLYESFMISPIFP